MEDILGSLREWLAQGVPTALATVIDVVKSAPRQPGAAMAVNGRGEVVGSVSGGCVEGALYEEATRLLAEGGSRLVTYGIADDDAFAVGLTCGGTIHLYVERLDWAPDLLPALAAAVDAGAPAALVAVTAGPRAGARLLVTPDQVLGPAAGLGAPLAATLAAEARAMLAMGRTGLRQLGAGGEQRGAEVTAFIQSFAPPPRLFVFGAIDFAAAAVRMGKFLGYRVILCDARGIFATRARFPQADEVVVTWPHEYLAAAGVGPRDAILVLTHDSKFDVPALLAALRTPAAYIGALGSRATHERRHRELLAAGAGPADLERIASPSAWTSAGARRRRRRSPSPRK